MACWVAKSNGMLARGSSRQPLTWLRVATPIAAVMAAIEKLAPAEKHMLATLRAVNCQAIH
jgi:hypothetical protein